jgi:hypothetical protein
MATATVDTAALATLINQCFAKVLNGTYSASDQNRFLIEGKRLRGQLMNLLSAQFDAAVPQLATVNASLAKLNTKLSDDATVLANTAKTLNDIDTLVGNLDGLLKLAAGFV